MITYSFIIPHKNSPDLLKRCIKTIPRKNNVEIIIIDDNSNPEIVDWNSLNFKKEENITLIQDKTGKGAGHARNIGIKHARGKWILFADADDWYEKSLHNLLDKYEEDESLDLVYLNAHCINDKGKTFSFKINRYIHNYLKGKKYSEPTLRYRVWSPWTRMIKKNLIIENNLSFEETPLANDMKFGIESSFKAKSIEVYSPIVYAYFRPRSGSLTDKKYTTETYMLRLQLKVKLNKFYDNIDYPFKWPLWTALSLRRFKDKKQKESAKEIRKKFLKQIGGYNILSDLYISIKFILAKLLRIT